MNSRNSTCINVCVCACRFFLSSQYFCIHKNTPFTVRAQRLRHVENFILKCHGMKETQQKMNDLSLSLLDLYGEYNFFFIISIGLIFVKNSSDSFLPKFRMIHFLSSLFSQLFSFQKYFNSHSSLSQIFLTMQIKKKSIYHQ